MKVGECRRNVTPCYLNSDPEVSLQDERPGSCLPNEAETRVDHHNCSRAQGGGRGLSCRAVGEIDYVTILGSVHELMLNKSMNWALKLM